MSNLRAISSALNTAIGQSVTRPGYLVALAFDGEIVRLSSRGTVSWGGFTWLARNLDVAGLASDGSGNVAGELRIGNDDNAMSALVLGEGIAGRAVTIYKFYGETPAADEVEEIFAGQGDETGLNLALVSIRLLSDSSTRVLVPRGRITPASGFHHLTPPGTVLTWNGEKITLEPNRG